MKSIVADFRGSKTVILTILEALNFDFRLVLGKDLLKLECTVFILVEIPAFEALKIAHNHFT